MDKIILDLCGGTGSWSAPYKEAGYDVRLVTLPDNDVRMYVPPENVWGILAAPPCTEFSYMGARWWASKSPSLLQDAISIVRACLKIIEVAQPTWWVLENPMGRIRKVVPELGEPAMSFNPYDYGDPYSKKTLLWGTFNTQLVPNRVEPEWVYFTSRSGKKKRMTPLLWYNANNRTTRSITPPGFAKAFFEANP